MNIHFKNIELFNNLMNNAILKIEVGSVMYGLKNENSDTDYLIIYPTTDDELNSIVKSHHQLQYKDELNNIDYNFTSLHNFIYNAMVGDSTINIEIINSEKLIGTPLEFFYQNRKWFNTYDVIKSYLGLAKRDIKYFKKAITNQQKIKRYLHIYRGMKYAQNIMNNDFDFMVDNLKWTYNTMKEIVDGYNFDYAMETFSKSLETLRKELNNKFENNTLGLSKNLTTDKLIILNDFINTINKLYKSDFDFDISIYYDNFAQNIKYN